jgi:hypothetical protein
MSTAYTSLTPNNCPDSAGWINRLFPKPSLSKVLLHTALLKVLLVINYHKTNTVQIQTVFKKKQ